VSTAGLGANKWGEIKKISKPESDAPTVEQRTKSSALIDLAPPPRPTSTVVVTELLAQGSDEVPVPPATLVLEAPGVRVGPGSTTRIASAKRVGASAEPKAAKGPKAAGAGQNSAIEFVETSVYVSRGVADAFRDAAARRSMLMNQLIVDLAGLHGTELEQQARAAGRQPARRRSGERAVDPIRKVLSFTVGELAQLDKIAERCSWPRSRVVSELMKLADG
jgi:hypothetical protein